MNGEKQKEKHKSQPHEKVLVKHGGSAVFQKGHTLYGFIFILFFINKIS